MSTKIRLRALFALLAVAVLSIGIAACGGDDETTTSAGGGLIESNPDNSGVQITVGSKNFTEEFILGNIYAQALTRTGRHPHAVRILARAWIRVIWRLWQDGVAYDPAKHRGAVRLLAA